MRKRTVLFFAGSGKEEVVLRGLAFALHIGEQVRFLGYRNDVPELLAGADLLLMTSWFEGMPLTLLEAMLAGVPIVSTPWLGARNMLADGRYGFLTPELRAGARRRADREDARAPHACGAKSPSARGGTLPSTYDMRQMADAHRRMYLDLCGVAS